MDQAIIQFDHALRVVSGQAKASRPNPAATLPKPESESEQENAALLDARAERHSAGLMRVNHVGEVCAQALYQAQGEFSPSAAVRAQFKLAAKEEEDHLAWTAERLQQLHSHTSVLNPLWYAGAYALGTVAARCGDAISLGFVVETEKQVEAHLNSHLGLLPEADHASRAIVEQMRDDEIAHGASAKQLGAKELPLPVRAAMKAMAKIMTTTAYYL
ncbi:MAG: 2-polyprenyl-3-methyl-6-methoxy-1,4-benzoquinone monooxygenase [Burkholderiaceae bacterium]|nr:2-polyprenyl-3-methyl-6-methoxy-1,4-benzoquinone monooxygenase [Burkholderiaceae bacterium]